MMQVETTSLCTLPERGRAPKIRATEAKSREHGQRPRRNRTVQSSLRPHGSTSWSVWSPGSLPRASPPGTRRTQHTECVPTKLPQLTTLSLLPLRDWGAALWAQSPALSPEDRQAGLCLCHTSTHSAKACGQLVPAATQLCTHLHTDRQTDTPTHRGAPLSLLSF